MQLTADGRQQPAQPGNRKSTEFWAWHSTLNVQNH